MVGLQRVFPMHTGDSSSPARASHLRSKSGEVYPALAPRNGSGKKTPHRNPTLSMLARAMVLLCWFVAFHVNNLLLSNSSSSLPNRMCPEPAPSPVRPAACLLQSPRASSLGPSPSLSLNCSMAYLEAHSSLHMPRFPSLVLSSKPPFPSYPHTLTLPFQGGQNLVPPAFLKYFPNASTTRNQASVTVIPRCHGFAHAPLRRLSCATGNEGTPKVSTYYSDERAVARDSKKIGLFANEVGYSSLRARKQAEVLTLVLRRTGAEPARISTSRADDSSTAVVTDYFVRSSTALEDNGGLRAPYPSIDRAQTAPESVSVVPADDKRVVLLPQNSERPPYAVIHTPDLKQAQYNQLEKWLSIVTTGIFNEIVWGCPGPSAYLGSIGRESGISPALACMLLREAEFCLANYLLLDSLNALRSYNRAQWTRRDGSYAGLEAMLTLCEAEVYDWGRNTVANCERAVRNLELQFPPDQCL